MQSANPLLVMILVPVLTLLVYPRLGRLATPLRRMSAGMFLAASSFLVVAWLQRQIDAGHQLSILWQTLPYVILTTAEVLVSTTGLEFAFREAAPEMKSLIMSFFLLTVAFGNLLVAAVTKIFSIPGNESGSISAQRFVMYAGLTFAVAMALGVGLTLCAVAMVTVLARDFVARLTARHGASLQTLGRVLDGVAGVLIIVLAGHELWR